MLRRIVARWIYPTVAFVLGENSLQELLKPRVSLRLATFDCPHPPPERQQAALANKL